MNPETILNNHFNPAEPRTGAVMNLADTVYRAAPGFAPSDLKRADASTKYGKERGHPLKMVSDIWAAQLRALGQPTPPGYSDTKESTAAQETGSLYHLLLLEPDLFAARYAVVTPELQADLLKTAKERKIAKELPTAYSGNLKEAREFKKLHGGRQPTEAEQEQILSQARQRKLDDLDVNWHSRLTEFEEWKAEQESAGKTVIYGNQVDACQAMVDAIQKLEANRAVKEELAELGLTQDRCEVSLFATIQIGRDDNPGPVIQLKGRPDGVASGALFFDPKTAISCHFEDFALDIAKYGYDFSMGGYCMLSQILAEDLSAKEVKHWGFPKHQAAFLAQEKSPPFLAKIWHLPHSWLNYGAHRWLEMVRLVRRCYEEDTWHQDNYDREYPDRTGGPNYIEPPMHWTSLQNAIAASEAFKHIPEPKFF